MKRQSSDTTTLFVLAFAFLATLIRAQQICPLCATPADLPTRWDFRLQDGRTCRDVYLQLGELTTSNPTCQATKNMAQSLCCGNASGGSSGASQPVSPPVYSGPVGDEPACPICGTMEYPGIPNAFIVARYVGEFTCAQLYGRGLNGMTPSFMCGALQDFAAPVCGCGEYNPRCRNNPSQCYGGPGNSPVQQPVQRPVQPPIQRPVASPVFVQPTIFDRKTPPQGGKYSTKLANGRGGSASTLRGGRRGEETKWIGEDTEDIQEMAQGLEIEFRVEAPTSN